MVLFCCVLLCIERIRREQDFCFWAIGIFNCLAAYRLVLSKLWGLVSLFSQHVAEYELKELQECPSVQSRQDGDSTILCGNLLFHFNSPIINARHALYIFPISDFSLSMVFNCFFTPEQARTTMTFCLSLLIFHDY